VLLGNDDDPGSLPGASALPAANHQGLVVLNAAQSQARHWPNLTWIFRMADQEHDEGVINPAALRLSDL
jgi:hypothetical protein